MTDKSLYERLGGTYGIAAAVDVLVEKLFKNEIINQNLAAVSYTHLTLPTICSV